MEFRRASTLRAVEAVVGEVEASVVGAVEAPGRPRATMDARTVSVWSGVRWFVQGAAVGCVRPGGCCCGRLLRGCSCYRRLPPLLLPPPPLLLLLLPVVVLPVRCCRWWCCRCRWWCCRRRWCWCRRSRCRCRCSRCCHCCRCCRWWCCRCLGGAAAAVAGAGAGAPAAAAAADVPLAHTKARGEGAERVEVGDSRRLRGSWTSIHDNGRRIVTASAGRCRGASLRGLWHASVMRGGLRLLLGRGAGRAGVREAAVREAAEGATGGGGAKARSSLGPRVSSIARLLDRHTRRRPAHRDRFGRALPLSVSARTLPAIGIGMGTAREWLRCRRRSISGGVACDDSWRRA